MTSESRRGTNRDGKGLGGTEQRGEEERIEGRVDMTKAQYVWESHSETYKYVRLISINNNNNT
jgi:hypothetical protein